TRGSPRAVPRGPGGGAIRSGARISSRTWWPWPSSAATVWQPTNPAPPGISTRIGVSLRPARRPQLGDPACTLLLAAVGGSRRQERQVRERPTTGRVPADWPRGLRQALATRPPG